jgi:hypothetical protein
VLAFERQVVASLTERVDPRRRAAVAAWVEGCLDDMPEHLRAGVGAQSMMLGAVARVAHRPTSSLVDALDRSPITLLRQYPRLFRSLVLFAEHELADEPTLA